VIPIWALFLILVAALLVVTISRKLGFWGGLIATVAVAVVGVVLYAFGLLFGGVGNL
jgi:hypothetical protein